MADEETGEKTEAATPRKREEAIEQGNIWKSQELTSAAAVLGSLITVASMGPGLADFLVSIMGDTLGSLAAVGRDTETALGLFRDLARRSLAKIAAISAALGLGAVVLAAIQAKGTFTLAPLEPKWERLNPLEGLKKLAPSKRMLVELAKQFAKLAIIGAAVWNVLGDALPMTGALAQQDPRLAAQMAGDAIVRLLSTAGLAFLALAAADVFWQRFDYEQNLMMTKQEVKQEAKSSEGDGMVKARRRALGRARVRQQMLAKVPEANVVIVNPTHIAIALRYDPLVAPAPIVVAMGQRKVAERIKALALESGVPIIENRPLARAMIKACQVGMMIPAELYTAVAEILAFVHRQRAAARGWQGSAVA